VSRLASVLILVVGNLLGNLMGCTAMPPEDPHEALQKKCAAEARAEHYVGKKSVEDSMLHYDECMRRGGSP
jgi:hypothetical protein